MKRKHNLLNIAEQADVRFLKELSAGLSVVDFSGKNFRVLGPRQYSLMIENYQVMVAQTDVYYYPNRLRKMVNSGKWDFVPGELERYEVYVFENRFPMHIQDSHELLLGTPIDIDVWRSNYNTLMMKGTMATDRGFYRTHCFDNRPIEVFTEQNQHLFEFAKQLYNTFHGQMSKATNVVHVDTNALQIKPVRDEFELLEHRRQLLSKIQEIKTKQK